jgi:hypothetical protein
MSALGDVSRFINRVTGGRRKESLCGRMTRVYGHDCLFCRAVGIILRDADHCWRQRIHEIKGV